MIAMPPEVRPLPRHEQHKRDLLAAIAAESALTAAPPSRAGGHHSRAGWRRPGLLGPLAAAAAVVLVAAAVVGTRALLSAGTGRSGAADGSSATYRASTAANGSGATGPSASLPAAVLPAPSLSAPSPTGNGQWEVTSSFTVTSPVTALVVNDPVGSVNVTGGATGSVSVTARLYYRGAEPSVSRQLSAKTLTLGYSCGNCGVSFQITVPSDAGVTVNGGTSHVGLTGLAGDLSASTDVGSITGTGLSGAQGQFRTGTGAATLAYTAPPSRLNVTTGTGAISVRVPTSVAYSVSASTGLGSANVGVSESQSADHVISATANVGAVTVSGGG